MSSFLKSSDYRNSVFNYMQYLVYKLLFFHIYSNFLKKSVLSNEDLTKKPYVKIKNIYKLIEDMVSKHKSNLLFSQQLAQKRK